MKCQRSVSRKTSGINRRLERMSRMNLKVLALTSVVLAGFGAAMAFAQDSEVPQTGPAANGEPAWFILPQGGRGAAPAAPAAAPAPGGQPIPPAAGRGGRAGGGAAAGIPEISA